MRKIFAISCIIGFCAVILVSCQSKGPRATQGSTPELDPILENRFYKVHGKKGETTLNKTYHCANLAGFYETDDKGYLAIIKRLRDYVAYLGEFQNVGDCEGDLAQFGNGIESYDRLIDKLAEKNGFYKDNGKRGETTLTSKDVCDFLQEKYDYGEVDDIKMLQDYVTYLGKFQNVGDCGGDLAQFGNGIESYDKLIEDLEEDS